MKRNVRLAGMETHENKDVSIDRPGRSSEIKCFSSS